MRKITFNIILISIILISISSVSAINNITNDSYSSINDSNSNISLVVNSSNEYITNTADDNIFQIDYSKNNHSKSYINKTIINKDSSEEILNTKKINNNLNESVDILKSNNTNNFTKKNILKEDNQIYYVSIDGNDSNDGSENSPFRTINHAIEIANSLNTKTTIIIKKGVYKENNLKINSDMILKGIDNPLIDGSSSNTIIISYNNNLEINGISFINTKNNIINSNCSNLTIINSNISNGSGIHGGAIYFANGILNIINSNINNNTSINEGHGGAIYSINSTVYIINTTFNKNTAKDISATAAGSFGGAIFANKTNIFILNSTINNSIATEFGGAIFTNGNLSIINSTMNNNIANYGGAIYNDYNPLFDSGNVIIINSTFNNNKAKTLGGAVYAGNVNIENSTFIANNAITGDYGNGGAIFSLYNIVVNNSNFSNNIASYDGGALYSYYGSIIAKETRFINNTAYLGGGALISDQANNIIINCIFINNTARDYGGAISLSNASITNSSFINNTAQMGSAIFINYVNLDNSEFINNKATTGYAIEVLNNGTFKGISDKNILKVYNYPYINVQMKTMTPDGFYCFCVEQHSLAPYAGAIGDGVRSVYNSKLNINVNEYLKILYYTYCENLTDDQSITGKKALNEMQKLTWIFTDSDFTKSTNQKIKNVIRLYDEGLRINSTHATKTLNNGTKVNMIFRSLFNGNNNQNMVLFKLEPFFDNLTVFKKTLDTNVSEGSLVRFNITVLNNGNSTVDNIFVNDTDFDKNLVLFGYENTTYSNWNYTNGIFLLNSPLSPNQTASIIIIFNTTGKGILLNNVSCGFNNKTFSNASNSTIIGNFNMSVIKISNNKTVYIGNRTSFTIVVKNTGDLNLSNIRVTEVYYDGLIFENYSGVNWLREGDVYSYNNILTPGKTANFTVYFKTSKIGNFTNIVLAESNEIKNITRNNSTEVKNTTNTTNNTNNTNNINNTNTTNNYKTINNKENKTLNYYNKKGSIYNTGNPLYLLFIVLSLIGMITIKNKK